jgi:hypothetical protein
MGSSLKIPYHGTCEIFFKITNLAYPYLSTHIEDGIMQNHEQKQKLETSASLRFYGQFFIYF